MSAATCASEVIVGFFKEVYQEEPVTSQVKKDTLYSLPGKEITILCDTYRGCHVNIKQSDPTLAETVQRAIKTLEIFLTQSFEYNSLWINFKMPIALNSLSMLPSSFEAGRPGKSDLIYDYQKKEVRVWKWLNEQVECTIPAGATHNIGATALVCDCDGLAQKVLLVVNTRRPDAWNLPGGSFDPAKDKTPLETALRELQEETGLSKFECTEPPALIGEMTFPDNQFAPAINQIWVVFCQGLNKIPFKLPPEEISRAEWFDIQIVLEKGRDQLLGFKLGEEIKNPLHAATSGAGMKEIMNKKWMILHTSV